jgi:hypothetical protein
MLLLLPRNTPAAELVGGARMTPPPDPKMLTRDEIVQICGDQPDWKIARIESSGANHEELMVALTWAQENEVDTADHHPLTGRAAYVYEVLIAEEDIWGEEHRA